MYDEKPKKKKKNEGVEASSTFKMVAIILLLILFSACAIVALLALTGPSIGNIFSNVIEGLVTATPSPTPMP